MFDLGEWIALPHRTRPGQQLIIGPTALDEAGRLIVLAVEVRETLEGRRFRPIVAKPAVTWQVEAWRNRRRRRQEEAR